MNIDSEAGLQSQALENIFKEHLENSIACGQVLSQLFLNLKDPESYITQIKQLEEHGDRLTAAAYDALELCPYSGIVQLTEQFVRRLDDITDGINNTARIIDIFMPTEIESSADQLLSVILAMTSRLLVELEQYANNELASVRECRAALKVWEENADTLYHEWRKDHRRHGRLPLIAETDWTEILGVMEQTTDACYHAGLLLERITNHYLRQQGEDSDPRLAQ